MEAAMENKDIGFIIKSISEILDKKFNKRLRTMGITCSQMRILSYLFEHRGQDVTQRQLENYLRISHPTTVGLINRLKGKGFVICKMSEKDRRQKIIALKEPTDDQRRKFERQKIQHERSMLEGFSEEEEEELKRLLNKLYTNVSKEDFE